MDFAACCITDRESSLAPTRPDRASCRAGMHLDRPPDASASISRPTADPRLSPVILLTYELAAFRPDIAAATASRCHVTMTIATRPSPERDGGTILVLLSASRTKLERRLTIFSENQKSWGIRTLRPRLPAHLIQRQARRALARRLVAAALVQLA